MSLDGFYTRLQAIRWQACILYDRAIARGVPKQELVKEIKPLMDSLEEETEFAVENDLDGLCFAVTQMRKDAEAIEKQCADLMEKSKDLRQHASRLSNALLAKMDREKLPSVKGSRFGAVIVDGIHEGKAQRSLVIR